MADAELVARWTRCAALLLPVLADPQNYKAVELGGKKRIGPIKIPTGTFAWFRDPDGNMVGLIKSAA